MNEPDGLHFDEELDLTPPTVGAQYHPAESEELLLTLRDMIENARDVPLSASSMISKEEALDLLDDALHALPEELRAARWLLKEREEFLARTRHEAQEILAQARDRADRMVERTEVVKEAQARAYEIVDTAEADARRLRHEVEDFCDQKLASFEIVLERTQKLVAAGRAKLQGTNLLSEAAQAAEHGFAPPVAGGDEVRVEYVGTDPSVVPTPAVYDELSHLDEQPALYDDEGVAVDAYDDDDHWDDDWDDDDPAPARPRLTVVDDRYADLPPPPSGTGHPTQSSPTIREAAANFFDQDLA